MKSYRMPYQLLLFIIQHYEEIEVKTKRGAIYKALILRTIRSGYIIIGTFCQLMNTLSTL